MTTDKQKHFMASLLITLWVGLFFGAWWGVGASLTAGVGKEARDSRPGGTGWDWWDLAADGSGMVVGLAVLMIVKSLLGV